MAETALTVENLGKKYRLGTSAPYHRLSEMLQAAPRAVLTAPWKRWRQRRTVPSSDTAPAAGHHPPAGEFWAVRDVSFEVRQGEVVGIIGRNGAGKSTLLKLLSRITEPTTGRFGVRGRVGSLLEVGTGFHPELTGRENIELSGTLLGMNRREIRRHFDEIVAFAEIDDFLDTPVKRYSSGMYVRLGFAIAAHLNPEILIVDEVLAVGDAQFQKKCLGKMNDVAASGRTVLFVSHNMSAVSALCSQAIMLHAGEIATAGETDSVLRHYQEALSANSNSTLLDRQDRGGSGMARVGRIEISGYADQTQFEAIPSSVVENGSAIFRFHVATEQAAALRNMTCALVIQDMMGVPLTTLDSKFTEADLNSGEPECVIECFVERFPLAAGTYRGSLWLLTNGVAADIVSDAILIDVAEGNPFGTGRRPAVSKHGHTLVPQQWRVSATHSETATH